MNGRVDGFFLALAISRWCRFLQYLKLIDAWDDESPDGCAPRSCRRKHGHPLLLDSRAIPENSRVADDATLNTFVGNTNTHAIRCAS